MSDKVMTIAVFLQFIQDKNESWSPYLRLETPSDSF